MSVFASVISALMFAGGVELYFALAFVGCVKLRFDFGAAMFRLVERQAQRTERGGENRNAENHAYRQVRRPENVFERYDLRFGNAAHGGNDKRACGTRDAGDEQKVTSGKVFGLAKRLVST